MSGMPSGFGNGSGDSAFQKSSQLILCERNPLPFIVLNLKRFQIGIAEKGLKSFFGTRALRAHAAESGRGTLETDGFDDQPLGTAFSSQSLQIILFNDALVKSSANDVVEFAVIQIVRRDF